MVFIAAQKQNRDSKPQLEGKERDTKMGREDEDQVWAITSFFRGGEGEKDVVKEEVGG